MWTEGEGGGQATYSVLGEGGEAEQRQKAQVLFREDGVVHGHFGVVLGGRARADV